MNEKILIVDDEQEICLLIKSYLEKENYAVYTACDGMEGLMLLNKIEPDLVIMDVMLPDYNGVDLCLEFRRKTRAPIVFLSCKDEEIDKIVAFSAGGDDYITKPFKSGELIARVKAHLRRQRMSPMEQKENQIFESNGLKINVGAHQVFLDGKEIFLTVKEFQLLSLLMENPKRVFSSTQLFEAVWKTESLAGDSQTIMVYISNIRKKIEPKENSKKYIINIRGVGYKFNTV